jgi:hypothetical protein
MPLDTSASLYVGQRLLTALQLRHFSSVSAVLEVTDGTAAEKWAPFSPVDACPLQAIAVRQCSQEQMLNSYVWKTYHEPYAKVDHRELDILRSLAGGLSKDAGVSFPRVELYDNDKRQLLMQPVCDDTLNSFPWQWLPSESRHIQRYVLALVFRM